MRYPSLLLLPPFCEVVSWITVEANTRVFIGLTKTINDEGVWRIARRQQSATIEVYKVEETGHGDILSDEFKDWRIKLALGPSNET